MEFPEHDIAAENSFVVFLITISKLDLSPEVTKMLSASQVEKLGRFFFRHHGRKPRGILIL